MSTILGTKDLHVRYDKIEALHGASLKVESGQIMTVTGPNGAGKSTMLGTVIGALPATDSAGGVVSYLSHNLIGLSVKKHVAHNMYLVPEKRELSAAMSVGGNLVLGTYRRERAGERDYLDQMEAMYDLFPRLKERRVQKAGTFSSGGRQMLAAGHTLMVKPQLLMLDEPNLSFVPLIVKEVFHIISDLRRTGVTMLLAERSACTALQVADHGYVLETGDMTLEGAAQELAINPCAIEACLGLAKKAA